MKPAHKIIIIAVSVLLVVGIACIAIFSGNGNGDSGSVLDSSSNSGNLPEESYEDKKFAGIDPVFKESLGYYNESPSVFESANGDRYLFYTRNSVKNDDTTDSIAVRKGKYTASGWQYGEAKTILTASESGWDSKSVFGCDVIKGTFNYGGKTYSYLMAYSGSNQKGRVNAQIGLAVAETPDGEWVKVGTSPVVTFNAGDYDPTGILSYRGAIEPSLVSFDKAGKVYMFYTYYEYLNGSYVLEMDLSNLDNPVLGGRKLVEVSGLKDTGSTNTQLYSGDFVYDGEGDTLIAIRNIATTVSVLPKVSEGLQLVTASADILNTIDHGWIPESERTAWWSQLCSAGKIEADDTAVETDVNKMFGYERIFGGCIVSDEFGHLLTFGELDVFFTTQGVFGDSFFKNDDSYKYSQMIHSLTINY